MAKIKNIAEDFHQNESGITGQYKNWFLDYASYVILGTSRASHCRTA